MIDEEARLLTERERYDQQIKGEFELVGQRMTWLLASTSFLFGAFAVALTYKPDAARCEFALGPTFNALVKHVTWAIPVVGGVSALVVLLAVIAAHHVIANFKSERQAVEVSLEKYGYKSKGVLLDSWRHVFGNAPPFVLPPLLLAAWLFLFIARILA